MIVLLVSGATPAHAGRTVVTGHDADQECATTGGQCGFLRTLVTYARTGSTRPVLVFDGPTNDVATALDRAFGPGAVPRTVVRPRDPAFTGVAIDPAAYSAVIVASDATCGGCGLNDEAAAPDSAAIGARAGHLQQFSRQGGGVVAFAGAARWDGSNGDEVFYPFLGIPAGAAPPAPPFEVTSAGRALGLQPASSDAPGDVGFPVHNGFVANAAWTVLETGEGGTPVTLLIDTGGTRPTPPPTAASGVLTRATQVVTLPSARRCVRGGALKVLLRNVPPRSVREIIFVVGRRILRVLRPRRSGRLAPSVTLRRLPHSKRYRVRVRVLVAGATRPISVTRRYRPCSMVDARSPR